MSFLNKIKSWFVKEEPTEEEKKNLEENQEEFSATKLENQELLQILDSAKIDINDLALDKIESEAETISSYCKGLIKDLSLHQDYKNEKEKLENVIKAIGGKIKVINNHGLELKNLLANLEDHYYNPIIDVLKQIGEKSKKEDIQKLVWVVEGDLNLVKELDTYLTKVIGYNDLFNPDKNPQYKEEIEKEAMKRAIHGDLNNLINHILNTVVNKSLGIKAKIQKESPLDKAKELI